MSDQSYALITGASKGIGKAIAQELAKKRYNLLLVARSTDELLQLKTELTRKYGVEVFYLAIDLSAPGTPAQVLDWCYKQGYTVSILVNNAGYGLWGKFADLELEKQLNMMQLNMNCLVQLTHGLLPLLRRQKEAYILNIASTAAYQAVPTLALYAASKSFVVSFSRALRFEEQRGSVSVTCISPGPVDTNFIARAGMSNTKAEATFKKMAMRPEEVAHIGVRAMFQKKSELVPGFLNRVSAFSTRLAPKFLVERIAASLY